MDNKKKGIHEHEELMRLWKEGKGKPGVHELSCGCTAWCRGDGFPVRIDGPILYASEINDSLNTGSGKQ